MTAMRKFILFAPGKSIQILHFSDNAKGGIRCSRQTTKPVDCNPVTGMSDTTCWTMPLRITLCGFNPWLWTFSRRQRCLRGREEPEGTAIAT